MAERAQFDADVSYGVADDSALRDWRAPARPRVAVRTLERANAQCPFPIFKIQFGEGCFSYRTQCSPALMRRSIRCTTRTAL